MHRHRALQCAKPVDRSVQPPKGADGLYYDQEGMKYHRSGEEGQYMYEHVTSVL
jgi:hypothetical protein